MKKDYAYTILFFITLSVFSKSYGVELRYALEEPIQYVSEYIVIPDIMNMIDRRFECPANTSIILNSVPKQGLAFGCGGHSFVIIGDMVYKIADKSYVINESESNLRHKLKEVMLLGN